MDKPRPVPLPTSLVVKKGSKIRFSNPGGIPGPLSWKFSSTISASVRPVMEIRFRGQSTKASRALASTLMNTCSSWIQLDEDLAVAHLFLQQREGAMDHFVNQEPLATGGRGPAKGAQMRDDLGRLADLLHGAVELAQQLLGAGTIHLNLIDGVADEQADVVEGVIELMSHSRGELAESGQLGRLNQLLLLVAQFLLAAEHLGRGLFQVAHD